MAKVEKGSRPRLRVVGGIQRLPVPEAPNENQLDCLLCRPAGPDAHSLAVGRGWRGTEWREA